MGGIIRSRINKIISASFLIGILLGVFWAQASSHTAEVSSCQTISAGGHYTLVSDIISADTCITITASDVVFDGGGQTITGPDTGSGYGVLVSNPPATLKNVTVKNLVLKGWQSGVLFDNVEDGAITNVQSTDSIKGIEVDESDNNLITNNTVVNNTEYGIYFSPGSDNNTVTQNRVRRRLRERPYAGPSPSAKVLIVSNSIDSGLAKDFLSVLKERKINSTVIKASDFNTNVRGENRLIVILGGPDAPEGVGQIVAGLLTNAEARAMRKSGAQQMYTKFDVYTTRFTSKQKVIIVAGSDRGNTRAACIKNIDAIADLILK